MGSRTPRDPCADSCRCWARNAGERASGGWPRVRHLQVRSGQRVRGRRQAALRAVWLCGRPSRCRREAPSLRRRQSPLHGVESGGETPRATDRLQWRIILHMNSLRMDSSRMPNEGHNTLPFKSHHPKPPPKPRPTPHAPTRPLPGHAHVTWCSCTVRTCMLRNTFLNVAGGYARVPC